MVGCSIDLIKGAGRGSTGTLTAGSDCSYKCKFTKTCEVFKNARLL